MEPVNPKDIEAQSKVPLHLVPPSVMIGIAKTLHYGAVDRGRGVANWRTLPVHATVYVGAAMRHLIAWMDGEDFAPDSGLHHFDQVLGGMAVVRDAMACGMMIDDRPPKGPAAKMLEEHCSSK